MDERELSEDRANMEVDDDNGCLSSSDDDDLSNDEQDLLLQQEITKSEQMVKGSPYNYDAHIQLIRLLRKDGDLEKLRAARERMNEVFPLSPELWLDWLRDESKIATDVESRQDVKKLFERAVVDYQSVDVWLEYCQFVIGDLAEPDGKMNIRAVFEKAVTAVGRHISKGHLIWETYREFESAVLSMMQSSADNEESMKQVEEQTKKIASIFSRQLALPSLHLEQTYDEYKEWSSESTEETVKNKYDSAANKMKLRLPFEDELESSEKPHLAEYWKYIEFEESKGDPATIQSIYERAIVENCLVPDLWARYCSFVDKKLKIKIISLPLHERSVRNCPWSSNLWIEYLRACERFNQPASDIQALFDKAIIAGFTQPDEYRLLWLTYLEYLHRQVNWLEDPQQSDSFKCLTDNFNKAVDYIKQYFGSDGDAYCTIQQFWARIEARKVKNMEKARQIWTDIMASGNGKFAQMWMEYYQLERSFGDVQHERKVLQQGVQCASDNPELLVDALLTFEKDNGSLEQYDSAVARCNAQMERVNLRRVKAAEKETEKKVSVIEQRKQAKMVKKNVRTGASASHSSLSPQKENDKKPTENVAVNKPKIEERKKRPPPPGFSQHQSAAKKPKESTSHSSAPAPPSDIEKTDESRSVFLSNLAYSVEEGIITEIFQSIGKITSLRIVRDFKGRSKGFGYLEFEKCNEAEEALKKDRNLIEGRPMYVSKCDAHKTKSNQFKYETKLEKNKLFIKGLSFDTTKETLERHFKQYGEIKETRIVTYRTGKPKGLAFIEFQEENCASTAVLKADGTLLDGHNISVALSNPPERKDKANADKIPVSASLGATNQKFGNRGKGRTNLAMVPRTLATTKAPKAAENGSQLSSSKMSNSDFRAMLLKK